MSKIQAFINSGIAFLNQAENSISGLNHDKFIAVLKQGHLGERTSEKIFKDLNKFVNKKPNPKSSIRKKYPGAPPKKLDYDKYYYSYVKNMFDPTDEDPLERRTYEVEDYLKLLIG